MSADVREITQKTLDGMVSGQKAFFMSLIEKGQAKIVPTTTPATGEERNRPTREQERPSAFTSLIGHQIKVGLVDGNTVTGKLVTVWQFEITLQTAFNEIVILKHAIQTLELVS